MFKFVAIATLLAVCQASPDVHYGAPALLAAPLAHAAYEVHAPAITSYSYETRQVHPGPAIAVHHAPALLAAPVHYGAPLAAAHYAGAPLVAHRTLAAAPLLAHAPVLSHYGAPLAAHLAAPLPLSLGAKLLIKK